MSSAEPPVTSPTRLRTLVAFTSVPVALAVVAWAATAYRNWTLTNDGGYFLMMTLEVIAGKTPFVDFESIHVPGIFYLQAMLLLIHSGSPTALAAQSLATNLTIATSLGLTAWRLDLVRPTAAAWLAAVCFILYPAYEGMPLMLEPMSSALGWIGVALVSFAVSSIERLSTRSVTVLLALGGFAVGSSAMIKQPGAVFVVFATIVALVGVREQKTRRLALMIGSAALPLLIFAILRPAALAGFVQQVVVQTLLYAVNEKFAVEYTMQQRLTLMSAQSWIWLSLLAGALAAWRALPRGDHPGIDRRHLVAAASAIGVLLLLPSFSRPFAHYFLYPIPFALFCFFSSANGLVESKRSMATLVATVGALLAFAPVARDTGFFYKNRLPDENAAQHRIVEFIQTGSGQSQQILVLPASPEYYYLTSRTAPVLYYGYFHDTSHLHAAAEIGAPVFFIGDGPDKEELRAAIQDLGYRRSASSPDGAESWIPGTDSTIREQNQSTLATEISQSHRTLIGQPYRIRRAR